MENSASYFGVVASLVLVVWLLWGTLSHLGKRARSPISGDSPASAVTTPPTRWWLQKPVVLGAMGVVAPLALWWILLPSELSPLEYWRAALLLMIGVGLGTYGVRRGWSRNVLGAIAVLTAVLVCFGLYADGLFEGVVATIGSTAKRSVGVPAGDYVPQLTTVGIVFCAAAVLTLSAWAILRKGTAVNLVWALGFLGLGALMVGGLLISTNTSAALVTLQPLVDFVRKVPLWGWAIVVVPLLLFVPVIRYWVISIVAVGWGYHLIGGDLERLSEINNPYVWIVVLLIAGALWAWWIESLRHKIPGIILVLFAVGALVSRMFS